MHEIKSGIDLGERHGVGDHFIDMDLALLVPVHDFRYVGPASCDTKGRPEP